MSRQRNLFGGFVNFTTSSRKPKRPLADAAAPEGLEAPAGDDEQLAAATAAAAALEAKQSERNNKKRLRAIERREAGLRYEVVAERDQWLQCSHTVEMDEEEEDKQRQHGCLYKDSQGKLVDKASEDIKFVCGPCNKRLESMARRDRGKPDALTSGGRTPFAMRDTSLWIGHERSDFHIQTMQELENGPAYEQRELDDMLTPEFKLQCNYLLGVIWLAVNECSVSLTSQIRDLGDAWGVEMPKAMSHLCNLQLLHATATFFRRLQRIRLFIVRLFSVIGDGSNDVSDVEQESIGVRYTWRGIPRNEFVGMVPLDLSKSRDGQSPDAQCLEEAYDRKFKEVFTEPTGKS
jgi:hypothetical protein